VSVSLVMERAVIMHDPNKITAEEIREIIEDRGFEAEVLATDLPSPMLTRKGNGGDAGAKPITTTTLAVEGMTCGACTSAVEGRQTVKRAIRESRANLIQVASRTFRVSKVSAYPCFRREPY
jgi:copper chaperone CopZ